MSAAVPYFDAHFHLQDARLDRWRERWLRELPARGLCGAVLNGTREADWPAVAGLAAREAWLVPSFGLHPWHVPQRTADWQKKLAAQLDAQPGCGIGEIGLDRWIEGHDLEEQSACFTWQLALAAERNLPATIHCVRAWGALWDIVREHSLPKRGFLLHAYGGPAEMVEGFFQRGAYFSFSPSFLHERKHAQREIFRMLPAERLLVETDAPDLAPPPEKNLNPLPEHDGKPVNHPANLFPAYQALAELRQVPLEKLAGQMAENFHRWLGERSARGKDDAATRPARSSTGKRAS